MSAASLLRTARARARARARRRRACVRSNRGIVRRCARRTTVVLCAVSVRRRRRSRFVFPRGARTSVHYCPTRALRRRRLCGAPGTAGVCVMRGASVLGARGSLAGCVPRARPVGTRAFCAALVRNSARWSAARSRAAAIFTTASASWTGRASGLRVGGLFALPTRVRAAAAWSARPSTACAAPPRGTSSAHRRTCARSRSRRGRACSAGARAGRV